MIENFPRCFEFLLELEGGFARLKGDETTNLGVKKSTWESYIGKPVTVTEMRKLTPEKVAPLYRRDYWDRVSADDLPSGVDAYVFDFGVHSGTHVAITKLQHILGVISDGKVGPLTIAAAHSVAPPRLIELLNDERSAFLKKLKNYNDFAKGWNNRLRRLNAFCQELAKLSVKS